MKTTILLPVISLFLFLASCTNPSDKKVNDQTSESSESGVTSTDWQSRYDKVGVVWDTFGNVLLPLFLYAIPAILINSSNSMRVLPSASLMKNIAMPCVYAVQCQEGIRIR